MDLSREQIVEKLEEISALRTKALGIKRKIETYEPEDNYEREVTVPEFPGDFDDEDEREELLDSVDHADDDAIELMREAYDEMFHPAAPAEPRIPQFSSPGTSDIENKGNNLDEFIAHKIKNNIVNNIFPAKILIVAIKLKSSGLFIQELKSLDKPTLL